MRIAQSRTIQPLRARVIQVAAAFVAAVAAMIVATHASAASGGAQVKVGKTALGSVIVNAKGRTLYMFVADKHGKSVCYGSCATYWPPLLTTSSKVVGAGVKASLLGTTKRTGGKLQVTYNGHPLYTFAEDKKPGEANGNDFKAFGAQWYALMPNGEETPG
jgi:predicted lipoprotein with Yx(FWY)xxD motif